MNCTIYTLAGLNAKCGNNIIGGITEIYVAPYESVKYRINNLTHTLKPINYGDSPVKYILLRNSASMTTTYNGDSGDFTTELNINFRKLDTAKRIEIMALVGTPIIMIVKDVNGHYWYLGKDGYVEATSGEATTGQARGDINGYSITFSDYSNETPFEVTALDVAKFLGDYSEEYFTVECNKGSVDLGWYNHPQLSTTPNIEYSFDKEEWLPLDELISLDSNNPERSEVYLRGNNANGLYKEADVQSRRSAGIIYRNGNNEELAVSGNIMSLIYGDDFIGKTTISGNGVIGELVGKEYKDTDDCNVKDAARLVLPIISLKTYIYSFMFSNCASLVNAPELPATTLSNSCYYYMFKNCTSLVNAPELPATTLADECYMAMFKNCTSLVNAPELPATTIKDFCYYEMFSDCSNLINAPELPATTVKQYCYFNMFKNCASLVNAPELPAATLADYCYSNMFTYCYHLKYIKCLATNISAFNCTDGWLSGAGEFAWGEKIFVKNANMTWPTGNSGIPSGWTIQNA